MSSDTLIRTRVAPPPADILKTIESLARAARSQGFADLDNLLTEVLADLFSQPASSNTDQVLPTHKGAS